MASSLRGLFPGTIFEDVDRIQFAVETTNRPIRMRCFNKSEADEIAALLQPHERRRVQFTWLVFPRGDSDGE